MDDIIQVQDTALWIQDPPRWSFRGPVARRIVGATGMICRGDNDTDAVVVGEVTTIGGRIERIDLDGKRYRRRGDWPDDPTEMDRLQLVAEAYYRVDVVELQPGVEVLVQGVFGWILVDHARLRRLSPAEYGVWLAAAAAVKTPDDFDPSAGDLDASDLLDALVARAAALRDPAVIAAILPVVATHADKPWAMRALAAFGAAAAA